jgi:copper chaperone
MSLLYYDNTRMERGLFKVVGMYCSNCKPIVERQLRDGEGVKNIDIDYMTDSIIVDYDPLLITKALYSGTLISKASFNSGIGSESLFISSTSR